MLTDFFKQIALTYLRQQHQGDMEVCGTYPLIAKSQMQLKRLVISMQWRVATFFTDVEDARGKLKAALFCPNLNLDALNHQRTQAHKRLHNSIHTDKRLPAWQNHVHAIRRDGQALTQSDISCLAKNLEEGGHISGRESQQIQSAPSCIQAISSAINHKSRKQALVYTSVFSALMTGLSLGAFLKLTDQFLLPKIKSKGGKFSEGLFGSTLYGIAYFLASGNHMTFSCMATASEMLMRKCVTENFSLIRSVTQAGLTSAAMYLSPLGNLSVSACMSLGLMTHAITNSFDETKDTKGALTANLFSFLSAVSGGYATYQSLYAA